MKQAVMLLLVGLLLTVVAVALARLSQLLAPRVGWPLIVVLAGGGLGAAGLILWQQQLVRSWPGFLLIAVLAGLCMAVAGHIFDWRDAVAASIVRQEEAIRKQPQFAALIEEQTRVPTWSEYMTPTTNAAEQWAWWTVDAAAKLGLALAILSVGKRNEWFALREGTGELA